MAPTTAHSSVSEKVLIEKLRVVVQFQVTPSAAKLIICIESGVVVSKRHIVCLEFLMLVRFCLYRLKKVFFIACLHFFFY